MKSHRTTIEERIIRASRRVTECRYRVVAVGVDGRNRIIGLKTNTPRLQLRGYHAEERILFSSPPTLRRILLARVNVRGEFLPIDPCAQCLRLAQKRNVLIQPIAA